MPVSFYIPSYLRAFTAGQSRVALSQPAATVAQALDALAMLHPGLRERVLTESGSVRPHINIFVGEESIRDAQGLATPVPRDCEIAILPAVSGGVGARRRTPR